MWVLCILKPLLPSSSHVFVGFSLFGVNLSAFYESSDEGILTLLSFLGDRTIKTKILNALNTVFKLGYKRVFTETNCPPPSTLGGVKGASSNISKLGIRCHRPLHELHVALQVQEFGMFMDKLDEGVTPSSIIIDKTLEVMLSLSKFTDENTKTQELTQILIGMFSDCEVTVGSRSWGSSSSAKSDISVSFENRILVNFEMKRELASDGAEPNLKNIGYFIHFQRSNQNPRAPMVLVSIVGPHYLQVFGATWFGDLVCVDPLCSPVSLLFVPQDPNESTLKLARLFHSLAFLIKKLKTPSININGEIGAPYYTHDSQLVNVTRMGQNKHVYEATMNGDQVVLKFSTRYGIDVHNHLASNKLAPKVISHAKLSGKWYVTIMEKIDEIKSYEKNDTVVASLKSVLDCLKSKNYVHGDLRRPNILVLPDDTVRVLDFDWAGTEGIATYPIDLNLSSECGWRNDIERGQRITSGQDMYMLSSQFPF